MKRMFPTRIRAFVLLVLAASLVCAPVSARPMYHRSVSAHFAVAGVSQVSFVLADGDLHLVPAAQGSGSTVAVRGEISSTSQPPADDVTISGKREGDRFVVTIARPHVHRITGTFSSTYDVEYPANLALRVVDSAGDVTVAGARASLSLWSQAGDVKAQLANDWSGTAASLRSNAGDVEVDVPAGFHGVLRASTHAGEVRDNAGLPEAGAGAVLDLSTNAGNVVVNRVR